MTLYDLVCDVVLQGNIRISSWHNDAETVHFESENCDDIHIGYFDESLRNREVTYMFCPGDGYLHIEIESEDQT